MTELTPMEMKFLKYQENIKKAMKKYCEANRNQLNQRCRDYYHERLATNEEYKEKKRIYNRELYLKKKELKQQKENIKESIPEINN